MLYICTGERESERERVTREMTCLLDRLLSELLKGRDEKIRESPMIYIYIYIHVLEMKTAGYSCFNTVYICIYIMYGVCAWITYVLRNRNSTAGL